MDVLLGEFHAARAHPLFVTGAGQFLLPALAAAGAGDPTAPAGMYAHVLARAVCSVEPWAALDAAFVGAWPDHDTGCGFVGVALQHGSPAFVAVVLQAALPTAKAAGREAWAAWRAAAHAAIQRRTAPGGAAVADIFEGATAPGHTIDPVCAVM
jgi:hypothetical protein